MIVALLFSKITISFLKQQQCIVLVTPPLWWHMWGAVLAVERACRECILLILLSLDAPGMSSNHRGRRPGARCSEDARRQSAGVGRFFVTYNSSASPAEDVLGLVPLTGYRRAVLPFMHGRSFTAPLAREALRAERRAAAALTSCTTMQIMA